MSNRVLCSIVALALVANALPAGADTLNRTIEISPGGTLRIAAEGAEVRLLPGPPGQVSFSVNSKGTIGEDVLVESGKQVGGASIELRLPARASWLFGWGARNAETRLEIQAPPDIGLDLAVSGGNLESSLDVSGSVDARVSGGALKLARVGADLKASASGGNAVIADVGGTAELRSSGGDVEIGRVGGALRGSASGGSLRFGAVAGDLDVRSSGGDVRGGPIDGSITARASGGSLRLGVKSVGTGGEISSSGGDVILEFDPAAAFDLDVSSSGGEVKTGIPVSVEGKIAEGRLSGKVNGGGALLRVRASGGSIHLEPASSR